LGSTKNKKSVMPFLFAIAIISMCIAGSLFTGAPYVNAQSEETTRNFWEKPAIMIFLCGFIGAVAPEIVRRYQLAQRGEEIIIPSHFIIVSVFFAILGGVIAIVLEAKTFYAAFYNGVSLPSLMKTYVGEPIPETTISNPGNPNKSPKKREITLRQYLGALSINFKKSSYNNKGKKPK